ncbi:hypothetical protein TTHT_0832 [Thermotomaculum hydrothermale]|uniref:Pentapeptide repeat-containing protein n=1 Tax=Thermotomaculum hydrothermale TaxID=981385 RepID=A0A7R6PQB7_9BACT|nr:pentapeptide repeat-containing protein [Thermotomaculum hydrothermale]BBB32396.1 hypothetical protein TTHT_0832 [Thermotomaculum hydrothermale]
MGYKAVFLDGTDGLPLVECEVCKIIERNVIEPAVIYVNENEDISNLSEKRINQLIGESKKLNNGQLRCIFHCEKENEIWIENIDEYKEWKEKREKAREEKRKFNEKSPAEWKKNLVDEFWKRIRAYRFAVDYSISTPINILNDVKFDSILVSYYRKKLTNQQKNYYSFNSVIFPKFNRFQGNEKNENKILKKDFNFWYFKEEYKLLKTAYFQGAKFVEEAYFRGSIFQNKTYFQGGNFQLLADFTSSEFQEYVSFSGQRFQGDASFASVKFQSNSSFTNTEFQEEAYFVGAKFIGEINFEKTLFQKHTYFNKVVFQGDTNFWKTKFEGDVNFWKTKFEEDVNFWEAEFKESVNLKEAKFQNKTYFWIVKFKGNISFVGTEFQRDVYFFDSIFEKSLVFRFVTITSKFVIEYNHISRIKSIINTVGSRNLKKYLNKFQDKNSRSHISEIVKEVESKILERLSKEFENNNSIKCIYKIIYEEKEKIFEESQNHQIFDKHIYEIIEKICSEISEELSKYNPLTCLEFFNPQFSPEAQVELRNLNLEVLKFNNLINHSKEFIIFNLKVKEDENNKKNKDGGDPLLEINNSLLNRMRFVNCDFSEAKIKIKNSSLTDCEFVNVDWGEIPEERICPNLFESNPKKAQDIYRQLKLAHDNQKDFIHGNDFYALEMRAYDKYLTEKRKFLKTKKEKNNFNILKDLIIFKISKIASNFGQDWVRVLKWICILVTSLTIINLVDTNKMPSLSYLIFIIFLSGIIFLLMLEECDDTKHCFKIKALVFSLFVYVLGFFSFSQNNTQRIFNIWEFFVTKPLQIVDFIAVTISKIINPWKTIFSSNSLKHIHGYEAFFVFSWIILSYLVYQLIISLRRKIRR